MKKMWALLVYLGEHMWGRKLDTLRFDREVWNNIIRECLEYGLDTIVLDCGEGIRYKSHPELAINGSWDPEELNAEVKRVNALGIQIIPKLNFSAAHDLWFQEYGLSKISTPEYYSTCKELINELYEIFDAPKYIHLGLDEESPDIATPENHYRVGEALLKDYKYLCDCVRETGAVPCLWNSPFIHYEEAYDYFDKDVVIYSEMYYTFKKEEWTRMEDQDDWVKNYYKNDFPKREQYPEYVAKYGDVPVEYVEQDPFVERTIRKREEYVKRGYQVVAATSNIFIKTNDRATVEYYHGSDIEHGIAGYFACPWIATTKENEAAILEEIRLLGNARREFYGQE